jgi:hypothetical protein
MPKLNEYLSVTGGGSSEFGRQAGGSREALDIFVNGKDEYGWTAFMWAMALANTDAALALLQAGANPTMKTNTNSPSYPEMNGFEIAQANFKNMLRAQEDMERLLFEASSESRAYRHYEADLKRLKEDIQRYRDCIAAVRGYVYRSVTRYLLPKSELFPDFRQKPILDSVMEFIAPQKGPYPVTYKNPKLPISP